MRSLIVLLLCSCASAPGYPEVRSYGYTPWARGWWQLPECQAIYDKHDSARLDACAQAAQRYTEGR